MTINSAAMLKGDSLIAKSEKADCVVYATASAFDLTYDEAHQVAREKFNRKDRRGTQTFSLLKGLRKEQEEVKAINTYTVRGRQIERKAKVYSFAEANPQGTYFILVSRHALVIKDGVVYDNRGEKSKHSRIKWAFKIINKNK